MPVAGGEAQGARSTNGPSQNTRRGKGRQKKNQKKTTYLPTYLFLRFCEIFRSDFRKYFYGVFGLLMQRNGQKRNNFFLGWEKTTGKKFLFLNFFGQKFLTWIFPKRFLWCF
jgi:hypothetical protein